MLNQITIVITLVHGTFARNAQWVRPDSHFCKLLTQGIPGPVKLLPFYWSGKNTERARQAAAHDLREHLRRSVSEYPQSSHFIVGHSHGGNISVYAVRGTDLEEKIAGIICLAVPFLSISPRLQSYKNIRFRDSSNDETVFYLFALTGFCMFAASLGICTGLILNAFNVDASNLPVAPFIVANFIGCLLAIASIPKLTRVAEHICKAYEPSTAATKLMILRSVGDEATGLLTAATFSGWALRQIHRALSWPVRQTSKERLLSTLSFSVLLLPSILLAFPFGIIASVFMLPFGIDLAMCAIWLDVAVEATPVGQGTFQVTTLSAPEKYYLNKLRHSAIYDDPRAVPQIAGWIRSLNEHRAT